VRLLLIALAALGVASAQNAPSNPLLTSSKMFYTNVKGNIVKSADKVPEAKYSFAPTDGVRTFGQILAHVADGQYEFCGAAKEGPRTQKDIEHTAKTKAEIVAALNEAFAFCDAVYAGLTDATASTTIPGFGGQKFTRLSFLDFNVAHTSEHYGNLVTYMRILGMVPPSSESRR
jgi:uncharacterized damage-inducible protein DinB